eukprot:PhF_6_TR13384/c0_g1_i1/m.21253
MWRRQHIFQKVLPRTQLSIGVSFYCVATSTGTTHPDIPSPPADNGAGQGSLDEISKALTALRREHQHARFGTDKKHARRKALDLFPHIGQSLETIDSKSAWIWLNNAVYFHCDYDRVKNYVTWVLTNPRNMNANFAGICNSLSHMFRSSNSLGFPPISNIPDNVKEAARQAFDGDYLQVALELTSDEKLNFIEVIMILSAFARMGVRNEQLYANIAQHVHKAIPNLKFVELASVASSFTKVHVHPKELFRSMIPRAKATVATGSPKDVSTLGNAFIKAGVVDKELFEQAAVIMAGRARGCKSFELAGLISTFAKAGITNPDTLNTLVEVASTRALDRFTKQEICFVLPAIAKFPVKTASVFEGLATKVSTDLAPTLTAEESKALFCAFAKCDSRKLTDTIRILLQKIQQYNERYGPKESMSLLDALTRLQDVLSRPELNAMYKNFEGRAIKRLVEGGMVEAISFVSMMARDAQAFKVMPNTIEPCRQQLKLHLHTVTPSELSVVLNAITKANAKVIVDSDVGNLLLQQCQRLLEQCKAVEVAAVLGFLTSGVVQGADDFTKAAVQCVMNNVMFMSCVELSTTAYILSKMSIPEARLPELWDMIDKAATAQKNHLTATQIGGLMSSFVRVEITPTNFFKQIVDVLVTRHAAALTPQELCEILGAYAKRGFEEDTVFASLAERVSQVAPVASPHEFATILHAFAKFGIRNEVVFYDYLPRIMAMAPTMKPAELSTVIVAYARVGVWNLKVFTALSQRMKQILNDCSTQDIASVLNAFANMEMKDEGFFLSCGDRVVSVADRCSVREMVSILHAFHEVEFTHQALLNLFLDRLAKDDVVAKSPLGDCVFIATSMPRMSGQSDSRLAIIYETLAKRFIQEVESINPPAIAGILHSFYRKRIDVPSCPQMFEVLTARAAATVEKFHLRNLAMLLGAITKSHVSKGNVTLGAFVPRVLQLLPLCNAHNIMTVSTAFASDHDDAPVVDHEAHEKVVDALLQRSLQLLPTLRPHELAWIVRNLTVLSAAGGNLEAERGALMKMLERVRYCHQQLGGKDCGNLLRVCSLLGLPNEDEVVSLLCNRSILVVTNTPVRGIAETLDSLRIMNKAVPEYFNRVVGHLEKSKDFNQGEAVKNMIAASLKHFNVEMPTPSTVFVEKS